MCVLRKNSNGHFFHTHNTAHILPPHIPTSWEPSKMPSVGKGFGVMTTLLKRWRSDWEYKIQTGTRRGICSCCSLVQGYLSWWTLFSRLRCLTHLSRGAPWLRHYATNRQVAGSIPDCVIGIFQWHNPSGRTMALGSTQPLTEMSTRCISWGLGRPVRKADNLTTILCRCHEIWEL